MYILKCMVEKFDEPKPGFGLQDCLQIRNLNLIEIKESQILGISNDPICGLIRKILSSKKHGFLGRALKNSAKKVLSG